MDAGVGRTEGHIGKAVSRGRMSQKAAEATRATLIPTMEIKDLAHCDSNANMECWSCLIPLMLATVVKMFLRPGVSRVIFPQSNVLALERLANSAMECALNQEERG